MDADLSALKQRLAEISDLYRAGLVLRWDLQVTMPPLGGEARAEALGTIGRIAHERFTDDEVGSLLERLRPLEESLDYDSDDASLIRVTRRDWEKLRRVPSELRAAMLREGSRGHGVWVEARAKNDFASFLPVLEKHLELKRRYIECFEWEDSPYTPLLDDFEPFMETREVAEVFGVIRPVLTELVHAAPEIDSSFLESSYPETLQREFADRIIATLGFEDGAWRLDTTAHPFCTSFSTQDVRLTTRYHDTGLESIWSTMHESGHGLYAHGIAPSLERTPLAMSPSFGINESQSRTWENLVGRSLSFWRFFFPRLQETFPEALAGYDAERWYAEVNAVERSLIRVEADEATYSFHIILRFELEQKLIADAFPLEQLPEEWNRRMWEYVGVDVPDDTRGVLQDTHWAGGSFGYFSTYALGNLISAQIWERVTSDLPELNASVEAGELAPLRDWLREHLHRYGRKFTPAETLERVVGTREIDPAPYVRYLSEKLGSLYGASSTTQ